jgi:peptidoglycan-associated lipoprotein
MLLIIGILATATGCSLFKSGGFEDQPETPTQPLPPRETPVPTRTPTIPATTTDDGDDIGYRPGDLVPLPELQVIYFDFDKFDIRSDQAARIENNLNFLKANSDVKVYIEGHCDERGTIEYNFNLGQKRANTVKEYYVSNGIAAGRIATVSKGEEEPVSYGHNEQSWRLNRRAEFKRMY